MKIRTIIIAALALIIPAEALADWDPAYSSRDHELEALSNRAAMQRGAIGTNDSYQAPANDFSRRPVWDPAYSSRDHDLEDLSNRLMKRQALPRVRPE